MISPFSTVLGTNDSMSGTEALQIEQIVLEYNKDIARIDKQIDDLQHCRAELIAARQAHKALISPIQRTPPELWAKIFILCLPLDEFVEINALEAPLLLMQICGRWRGIASSTPRLWNSICVGRLEQIPFGQINLIKAWLSRSRNLPLSIRIVHHDGDAPSFLHDFIDIFIPYSSRWSNLDLFLPQPWIERLLPCSGEISTPNLETLSLTLSSIMEEQNPLLLTQSAIRLRKITLEVDLLIPPYLKLPWSQLTDFRSYSAIDMHHCLDIFQLCSNLTHLFLWNIAPSSDTAGHPLVTMPRLDCLELGSQ